MVLRNNLPTGPDDIPAVDGLSVDSTQTNVHEVSGNVNVIPAVAAVLALSLEEQKQIESRTTMLKRIHQMMRAYVVPLTYEELKVSPLTITAADAGVIGDFFDIKRSDGIVETIDVKNMEGSLTICAEDLFRY